MTNGECDFCTYRNSWDCGDGYNRRSNCSDFKLDWDTLPDSFKRTIQQILSDTRRNDDWY